MTVGAQLGRRLHQRSNRGVQWQAMATSDFTIRTARILLRENPRLVVVDIMIVILGIGDAVRFTTPNAWRAQLADLQRHLASTVTILIAEIPPLKLSPEVPMSIAHRGGHHANVLNVVTRDVVADIDMAQSAFRSPPPLSTTSRRRTGTVPSTVACIAHGQPSWLSRSSSGRSDETAPVPRRGVMQSGNVALVEAHVDYERLIDDAVRRIRSMLPHHTIAECRDIVEDELAQMLAARVDEQTRLWCIDR
ncbi:hypothetical protein [Clavibacter michiganensis]|uniref:hypothetical protein n=2 Tax=Clavibacter michiganensis TaxID=28447 RepID=UPI000B56AABF|nr:hypothetical protein [Clavibacter michiganensis]MDO4067358.1 hypothetical protein [Clavibacter michiganensis]OUE03212.1 hypothetical protein CMMCAS04_01095 [Clavibacter michiganensis subsp. michiganensis]